MYFLINIINIICAFIVISASRKDDLIIITNNTLNFEIDNEIQLNATVEYILTFPNSSAINPYTVRARTVPGSVSKDFPILVVVRQARQVSSWTVPEIVETSQENKTLIFYNTSKTLCHDNMETIVMGSALNNDNENFPIQSLSVSQTFIVALSTSSVSNVTVSIMIEEEKKFFIEKDIKYTVMVSPSQSQFKFFQFAKNVSDTVVIEVDSPDDVCLTVSIQDSKCPVMDSNKDVKYEGLYQTVNKKGAITIGKRKFRNGFFLVFVAKPDDYECSQENSVIPSVLKLNSVMENMISTTVKFFVKDSITFHDYLFASFGTTVIIFTFGIIFTSLILIFNRRGTISKLQPICTDVTDCIEPLTDDEIKKIIRADDLKVDTFAKYPKRIKQRAFNYLSHTASIALFYSIPVIQLVITYQRVVNLTGNQDVCYYNFLCAHPSFGLSDFNHIFSNIGYFFIGCFFVIGVMDRQYRIRIIKDKGIPVHYGLFYAMGLALTIEGILSACYHICPTQSNYQFDTSFMYVMAVLMMVKLYQNRHPDINATAYSTFSVVGFAIFVAMVGILNGTLLIWVIFLLGYATLIIILSLKIYYFNFVMHGLKELYLGYKKSGFCRNIITPIRKGRFIIITIANFANFGILGVGVYIYINNITDFGTFLLGLLMANTILHTSFYTLMKILHQERISYESILFGILGLAFWISSGIFFLDAATLWTVTPAESRQWNQGCVLLNFYDKHDIWHLLSAPALYFTFLYLMYLDDDLCDTPQQSIPVF